MAWQHLSGVDQRAITCRRWTSSRRLLCVFPSSCLAVVLVTNIVDSYILSVSDSLEWMWLNVTVGVV